jgi:hypothetical protein
MTRKINLDWGKESSSHDTSDCYFYHNGKVKIYDGPIYEETKITVINLGNKKLRFVGKLPPVNIVKKMAIELMTFGRVKCIKKNTSKSIKYKGRFRKPRLGEKKSFWGKLRAILPF